mmetsp:Transcript_4738/g.13370  ORF Transcript_4738/g.13370 Transcript_4738/m.13370 type:complete len:264 (-) Transcript_4738:3192-3983(-)
MMRGILRLLPDGPDGPVDPAPPLPKRATPNSSIPIATRASAISPTTTIPMVASILREAAVAGAREARMAARTTTVETRAMMTAMTTEGMRARPTIASISLPRRAGPPGRPGLALGRRRRPKKSRRRPSQRPNQRPRLSRRRPRRRRRNPKKRNREVGGCPTATRASCPPPPRTTRTTTMRATPTTSEGVRRARVRQRRTPPRSKRIPLPPPPPMRPPTPTMASRTIPIRTTTTIIYSTAATTTAPLANRLRGRKYRWNLRRRS